MRTLRLLPLRLQWQFDPAGSVVSVDRAGSVVFEVSIGMVGLSKCAFFRREAVDIRNPFPQVDQLASF